MSNIRRIKTIDAKNIIADIQQNPNSEQVVMKLGKFYYDISSATEKELDDFIYEHNRRYINRPEFGATRI